MDTADPGRRPETPANRDSRRTERSATGSPRLDTTGKKASWWHTEGARQAALDDVLVSFGDVAYPSKVISGKEFTSLTRLNQYILLG